MQLIVASLEMGFVTHWQCGTLVKFVFKLMISAVVVHEAEAYSGFWGMKWLGVFLFHPGWDASP